MALETAPSALSRGRIRDSGQEIGTLLVVGCFSFSTDFFNRSRRAYYLESYYLFLLYVGYCVSAETRRPGYCVSAETRRSEVLRFSVENYLESQKPVENCNLPFLTIQEPWGTHPKAQPAGKGG